VKGKGDREKRIIALGFAGSKGRNQRSSSTFIYSSSMASGMVI